MRKKNFVSYLDNLFWYFIYLLPIFLYVIFAICAKNQEGFLMYVTDGQNFSDFMMSFFGLEEFNNVRLLFIDCLCSNDWVTNDDVLLTLTTWTRESPIVFYFSYFINCIIAHLFVDVLAFIPRLAHKWLGKCTQQD